MDIVSNKRRLKLAKLLEGFGIRVQRSCFEIDLEKSNYRSLLSELQAFYDADQLDNIIVYVGNREETLRLNADEVEIEKDDCLFFWDENSYKIWYTNSSFQYVISIACYRFTYKIWGIDTYLPREGPETQHRRGDSFL